MDADTSWFTRRDDVHERAQISAATRADVSPDSGTGGRWNQDIVAMLKRLRARSVVD